MPSRVFDELADRYDAWFDGERGRVIFPAEVECVRRLLPSDLSGWVEVGVGTGRFAEALGIPEGVDPCEPMLENARRRGIRTRRASAEDLPYPTASLDGVLLVVTLCFLDDADKAMKEIARVLKPGGHLVVGIVPADSARGEFYRSKGEEGHPFYAVARFYTCEEVVRLAASTGFSIAGATSTLPMGPGEEHPPVPVTAGIVHGFGFVVMAFRLMDPPVADNEAVT